MKKYGPILFVLVVGVVVILFFRSRQSPIEVSDGALPSGVDPANTTYLIEGERVLLTNSVFEAAVAGSSSTIRTAIHSQPVIGDLDHDGDKDMALLLHRIGPGSGVFYYVAAALQNTDTTAQGMNAIFVGDRIAPQSLEIQNGVIIFNYADRKSGEPMTVQPSVGLSLYAQVENGELIKTEAPEQLSE